MVLVSEGYHLFDPKRRRVVVPSLGDRSPKEFIGQEVDTEQQYVLRGELITSEESETLRILHQSSQSLGSID